MTYVMSDIHGDLDRFRSVMDQIHLKADDHLYVLGDVIPISAVCRLKTVLDCLLIRNGLPGKTTT